MLICWLLTWVIDRERPKTANEFAGGLSSGALGRRLSTSLALSQPWSVGPIRARHTQARQDVLGPADQFDFALSGPSVMATVVRSGCLVPRLTLWPWTTTAFRP